MEITIYCSQCDAKTPHDGDAVQINDYETMLIWKCKECDNGRSQLFTKHKHSKTTKNEKENYGTSK